MNISWYFLDKRQATLDALNAYNSMEHVLKHTDEQVKKIEERMKSTSSPRITGMPGGSHDPHATEQQIVDGIEEISDLKERYNQAVEYMKWFLPAWEYLTEDDRYVLTTMCVDNDYGDGAADAVAEKLHISRASAYRRKNRVLKKLVRLLYGVA